MATRYLVVAEKVQGEAAVISPATMEELGAAAKDSLTVTGSSTFFVTPFITDPKLPASQVKLPRRLAMTLKEGERVSVQPTDLTPPPPPAPGPSAQGNQRAQSNVATATQGPVQIKWDTVAPSDFEAIAGLGNVKARIDQSLYYLTHPEWFLIRKSMPPRVFMLFGPYGCGKTMLAKAMASKLALPTSDGSQLDVKLKIIKATEIKDPYLGMSARNAQQILDAARSECNRGSTVLLVLDEIDSLVSNRADKNTHEEYRDIVNSLIQDVQGVQELETELRIKALWNDPDVVKLRQKLSEEVRKLGKKDSKGDIQFPEDMWTKETREEMLALRKKVMDAGGVSTVIIVGTTNDPLRIDEAFISRAGDNIFFVSRPSADAIGKMLKDQLDPTFFDLSDSERKELAAEAFRNGLTGRDIMLSWLQPLRTKGPGSLSIMGYQSIKSFMPHPTVGIEWEMDLFGRLRERGHIAMTDQVGDYLKLMDEARKPSKQEKDDDSAALAITPRRTVSALKQKQPALFEV